VSEPGPALGTVAAADDMHGRGARLLDANRAALASNQVRGPVLRMVSCAQILQRHLVHGVEALRPPVEARRLLRDAGDDLDVAIWPSQSAAESYVQECKDVSQRLERSRNATIDWNCHPTSTDEALVKAAFHS
jgi:hypothetical protein